MLKMHNEHNNLSFLNSIYHRPRKNESGKYEDAITLVYKDNSSNTKYQETIYNPEYEYFMINEGEEVPHHNLLFIEKDKVQPVLVPYLNLEKDIAERTGNLEFFYENIKSGNRYDNRFLHTHTSVFRSDMNIEDYYMYKFNERYGINDMSITKSYLDIEADVIDMVGDFPELGECPINAVTVIDGTSTNVYTFLLRNPDNPLIEKLETSLKSNPNIFFNKLRNTIIDTVNGKKNELVYGLDKLQYQIFFYDNELELINDIFNIINTTMPDFVLAWNMGFDIPYIIERLKKLGVAPESVICHKDFDIKVCNYYVDERRINEFAERGDNATISSYSVYLDQLIHFASRRKGRSLFQSYALDSIGQAIAGVKKLDYSHITTDIGQLPYKDYETFVIYNIIDTIVQKCIEAKTDDIGYVYNKSIMNNTRYNKCHRNTIYLKNRGTREFNNNGLIIGNNANLTNTKSKYKGGLVADPLLNEPNGLKLHGVPTTLYDNCVDYDYKSLYPSMMREFNIAPHTQIGKIHMDDMVVDNENMFNDEDYDRSGAFIEDLISKNFLVLLSRWFKLGTYAELYNDIVYYYSNINKKYPNINKITKDGHVIPIGYIKSVRPVRFDKDTINPIALYHKIPTIERNEI